MRDARTGDGVSPPRLRSGDLTPIRESGRGTSVRPSHGFGREPDPQSRVEPQEDYLILTHNAPISSLVGGVSGPTAARRDGGRGLVVPGPQRGPRLGKSERP